MATPRQARSALGNTIKYHPGDHEAIAARRAELDAALDERAVDDPVALARAARIVRIALQRGKLTLSGGDHAT